MTLVIVITGPLAMKGLSFCVSVNHLWGGWGSLNREIAISSILNRDYWPNLLFEMIPAGPDRMDELAHFQPWYWIYNAYYVL